MNTIFTIFSFIAMIGFPINNVDATSIENTSDTLPNGESFVYEEPFYTDFFHPDDLLEEVTIHEEVIDSSEYNSDIITPFRIEPGWAKYISKAYWITRDGVRSISIYPRKSAPGWTKERAWQDVKTNFSFYNNWKNETSLRNQFYCHARNIWPYSSKIPWNIEPSKKSTNIISCN